MKAVEEVVKIGYVIQKYLEENNLKEAKPKDLMPLLIKKGIFKQDHREGLPLRELLKQLERAGKLYLIPQASFEQKNQNKYWFFNALEL
ncbi:hypothetical protein GCM10007103_30610 [Salinimicrobium marinum]|uniref:Uncharacterized protein n=2 Tax=Salinimicrobium marinum TaxID=680283 RepID=A0A918SJZ8_9FLAO|nr:hypothetical protein GCM10007103_30610 [Salinimicrobium marinum]